MTADPVVFPLRRPPIPPRGVARPSRAQPCHTAVVIENAITHPEGGRESERATSSVKERGSEHGGGGGGEAAEKKHTCWSNGI